MRYAERIVDDCRSVTFPETAITGSVTNGEREDHVDNFSHCSRMCP